MDVLVLNTEDISNGKRSLLGSTHTTLLIQYTSRDDLSKFATTKHWDVVSIHALEAHLTDTEVE